VNAMSAACSLKPAIPAAPKTISVDGIVIPRAAIARETQNHPAAKPAEAWLAAARALVVRQLLLAEATRLGVPAAPIPDAEGRRETDEEATIRALIEREAGTPEPDDAACRRVYDTQRHRFRAAPLFEVRHILVAAHPSDDGARREARACAERLLAELAERPYAFAELALSHSACPSASLGGALGQIGPGSTVPEFEAALARLDAGVPVAVETRYGVHVVVIDRRVEGSELPFEAVRDRIAAWLRDRVRHLAIRQYLTILAGRAEITGIDLAGAASPLVR